MINYKSPFDEPIGYEVIGHKGSSKEERLKSTKDFLRILVDRRELTQEEADERLRKYIEENK